ncbi:MAG: LysR family transcriptional regulator [Pseudomonadota bacterium]
MKQLDALFWVADLLSLRTVADQLSTTQPNISARLAALETLVGQSGSGPQDWSADPGRFGPGSDFEPCARQ